MKELIKNGRLVRVYPDGKVERSPHKKCKDWTVCIESDNGAGYLTIGANEKRFYVHRLVAEAYLEKPSEKHTQVNHKDGNKSNNHVDNLEWITPSENIRHAHKEGFMENRSKLGKIVKRPDEDVEAVYRDIVLNGMGVAEAAKKHGFQRTTVSSFMNKRSRRDITDAIDRLAEKDL